MKRIIAVCVLALAVLAVTASAGARPQRSLVSAQDMNWLKTSAQGDVFEIVGGRLALAKAESASVKTLANRLVTDHSKSLADAKKTAASFGMKLPNSATPSEQWELQIVGNFSGADFDRWYSALEVKDHQQDIEETTYEVLHGTSPKVRREARKDLPMLRLHLKLAQQAAASS
jgi:putative membrane protein